MNLPWCLWRALLRRTLVPVADLARDHVHCSHPLRNIMLEDCADFVCFADFMSRVPDLPKAMKALYGPPGPLTKSLDHAAMLGDGFCQMGLARVRYCMSCVFECMSAHSVVLFFDGLCALSGEWFLPLIFMAREQRVVRHCRPVYVVCVQTQALRGDIMAVIAEVEQIYSDLKEKCVERAHLRAEIAHYEEKVCAWHGLWRGFVMRMCGECLLSSLGSYARFVTFECGVQIKALGNKPEKQADNQRKLAEAEERFGVLEGEVSARCAAVGLCWVWLR